MFTAIGLGLAKLTDVCTDHPIEQSDKWVKRGLGLDLITGTALLTLGGVALKNGALSIPVGGSVALLVVGGASCVVSLSFIINFAVKQIKNFQPNHTQPLIQEPV